jgi:imidazolonepropionase-like amidohydrolase
MARTLLRGGTVVDVRAGRAGRADVLIEDDRIMAVGAPADFGQNADGGVLDVAGKTILPGFSNNHVHVGWSGLGWDGGPMGILRDQALNDSDGINGVKATVNLHKSLRVGLTALRDLGMNNSAIDAKDALTRGLITGPRLFIAGRAIMCTGGHTWWCGREADGPEGVRQAIREQVKDGADHIKMIANEATPQFTPDELLAAADEAHRLGRRITAHATIPQAIRNVVQAGFDSVEHGGIADEDVLEVMAKRGVTVVPTLSPSVLQTERGPARGMPAGVLAARKRRFERTPPGAGLARMREAGITFAFGTDAGSPCVPHDEILGEMHALLHYEIVTGPLDIIRMLTINSATLRGDADRLGTVEAGKLADLVVVDGDPLAGVDALAGVRHVFVGGEHLVRDGEATQWYAW